MRYRERKEDIQDINISPLIDMVFILLIFFMVSTTFVKDMKLDLDRPAAASAVTASTKAVRLYIDASGDTYLDGEPVQVWVIQSRLRDQLKTMTAKAVLVITDDAGNESEAAICTAARGSVIASSSSSSPVQVVREASGISGADASASGAGSAGGSAGGVLPSRCPG